MYLQGLILDNPNLTPTLGWLAVSDGRITARGEGRAPTDAPCHGSPTTILCPGFVDAHLHLPQFPVIGVQRGDLLQWLQEVVFPTEQEWSNRESAIAESRRSLQSMLCHGTTSGAAFLTSHPHGLELARQAAADLPVRLRTGVTLMNRSAPESLTQQPLPDPASWPHLESDRFEVSVNPRFAVSCSEELLAWSHDASSGHRWIQTHLAETKAECALVESLFQGKSYVDVYDDANLLTARTLLAHCIHLDARSWTTLGERSSIAVHCPTANMFLGSGVFDFDAARDHGVRVCLGSDVAGGPDIAMPRVARAMIDVASTRPDARWVPTPAEAWSMITRGNADALGWSDCGRLDIGSHADVLLLDAPFAIDETLISRLIFSWSRRFVSSVVVAGQMFNVEQRGLIQELTRA